MGRSVPVTTKEVYPTTSLSVFFHIFFSPTVCSLNPSRFPLMDTPPITFRLGPLSVCTTSDDIGQWLYPAVSVPVIHALPRAFAELPIPLHRVPKRFSPFFRKDFLLSPFSGTVPGAKRLAFFSTSFLCIKHLGWCPPLGPAGELDHHSPRDLDHYCLLYSLSFSQS